MPDALTYKFADSATEEQGIHRLNHRTFAGEIPQHATNLQGLLVDRFHAENTYAVCLDGDEVVGMVCGRTARPFSLDGKLPGLDRHLPAGRRPVEVRLLAVDPRYRRGTILPRLLAMIAEHFAARGCDLAVLSGTTRALEMYRRMGCVPFGPLTGEPGAQFQPMYLTIEDGRRQAWTGLSETGRSGGGRAGTGPDTTVGQPENLLPGPVSVAPEVAAAFGRPPAYHRSPEHQAVVDALHRRLAAFVNVRHAQLLLGSGTVANDAVAAQLRLLDRPGLVLAYGEFGERLADHATRTGLDHEVLAGAWGAPLPWPAIERAVAGLPAGGWLWSVHCETSTGQLIDLPRLTRLCAAAGVRLCVDAISSVGTLPVDLSGAYLATGTSGKALGGYPGLSMVFLQELPRPSPGLIPRYLDLGCYAEAGGIAYTQSSNLVAALDTALAVTDWPDRYARLARASTWLDARLRRLGLAVVASRADAAPGIVTIALPAALPAAAVGARLEQAGYLLAYQSGYLRDRNWLQISLMGRWTWPALRGLLAALAALAVRPG
ncbi:GNAT family N-acetyltransferase [Catellatospora sichuanensis]|uniref:GNAT family N-acetyltransferase n=1 Tax=Catellatospora sichuanensis TaxID=1969805 RepID=UPI001642E171|nr:GNAT family N-acetyltransferase [Catellatospora sichuanensis]